MSIAADELAELYGMRFELVRPAVVDGKRIPGLYIVDLEFKRDFLRQYVLVCAAALKVAAHPHIVLDEFHESMKETARLAVDALRRLGTIGENIVFYHILRAAPGYHLHDALREKGFRFKEVFIRPQYVVSSYADHTSQVVEDFRITFEDFSKLSRGKIDVFKPDTEATGRTALVSLERLRMECESKDCALGRLVLYGYISEDSLKEISRRADLMGFEEIISIALVDLPKLASNNYDMPAFGPDLALWRKEERLKYLGSIMDRRTFERMLTEYVPGMDQPGDFSERQKLIYNGHRWTRGDVLWHLRRCEEEIRNIMEIPGCLRDFQKKAAEREIRNIYKVMEAIR